MSRKASSSRALPPASVVIAHATWDVEYNDAECAAMGSDGHTLVGGRRIALKSDLCLDREQEVMLHEALHACIGATTLELDEDDEESLVNTLTGPVLDLIRRNPDLVEYLRHGH